MTTGTADTRRSEEPSVVEPSFWRKLHRLELPTDQTTAEDVRPVLLVLGLPTFGLAFAITILTTYGPSVLLSLTHSPARVGALIGGEGAFALVVPLISGAVSDRLPGKTPGAKRMPFVLIGGPMVGAGLVILPFAPGVSLGGISILMFFVGYYLYYPPYRAIYADILPKRLQPRAQSSQAILRGAGFGVALIAGGLLLGAWTPLPFVIGAAVIAMSTVALKPVVRLQNADTGEEDEPALSARDLFLHHRQMQIFAAANSLWEFSLAGLKTFVILYLTHGLHRSSQLASACLALVAIAFIVGAPIASRLAERVGIARVMMVAAAVYGATLCLGVFPTSLGPMLLILPVCAFAGSILMTLPQALAFTLAPDGSEGAAAGLVDFSRGVGVVLGPAAVGGIVGLFSDSLSSTAGYAIMWPTIGVPVLVSLFFLRRFENQSVATAAT
ncbi:MAG: MFS transporter [Frankiaceae bacterium]|nr:MFS transporter [Frankiaceae bacterium]MBV9872263.1 MFS transporter [Frankiaceae bacterium]